MLSPLMISDWFMTSMHLCTNDFQIHVHSMSLFLNSVLPSLTAYLPGLLRCPMGISRLRKSLLIFPSLDLLLFSDSGISTLIALSSKAFKSLLGLQLCLISNLLVNLTVEVNLLLSKQLIACPLLPAFAMITLTPSYR